MARLDITQLTRAADELLEVTAKPRHRRILENYRRHALLEVSGNWPEIFAPDMTVNHPVYLIDANDISVKLDGLEQVTGFYRTLTDAGSNVIVVQDEQLAVADWGLASEAIFNSYARGAVAPGGLDGHFYIVRQRIAMHWPYDDQARLMGEHVYEHAAQREVVEIGEADFITPQDAERLLTPLLRSLPQT